MKLFAIKENKREAIGYLFYYEKSKRFYIELLDGLSEWDIPLLLSSLYKKRIRTIDSKWSKVWVRQRIVPNDRQNIGQILRDNKLKAYDEYDLLMLANGRCEQDDFYLSPSSEKDLPEAITNRFVYLVENVMALNEKSLVVCFRNGMVKSFDMNEYVDKNKQFEFLIRNNYLNSVKVMVGGYGIYWDSNFEISNSTLFTQGQAIEINSELLDKYLSQNILTTSEVMQELGCSRQYVNELVKNDKIHPIKSSEKVTLFNKTEILKMGWI